MKLLLTSAGIRNDSIKDALADLLTKRFSQARVVFVPTAANPERGDKTWLAKDYYYIAKLGWKNFDVVDLAATTSLDASLWWHAIERADCLIFGGGNTFYLSHWVFTSGLADKLPHLLQHKIYVGISAGSMIATHSLHATSHALDAFGAVIHRDAEYNELGPKGQSSAETLKLVDFVIRPHFDTPGYAKISDDFLQKLAPQLPVPLYALDDESAIIVTDGNVNVVTEGTWKFYDKK